MPIAPPRPCNHPGCKELTTRSYCDKHGTAIRQAYDKARGSSTQRGYNAKWQRARALFLKTHYECVRCREQGRLTRATVVDHRVPHKGDQLLFWNKANWQALCKPCHDSWKQQQESTGNG